MFQLYTHIIIKSVVNNFWLYAEPFVLYIVKMIAQVTMQQFSLHNMSVS